MDTTLDLVALLKRVPNATITVQLSDLNAFAHRLITDTREEYEQEISDRLLAIKENYLTADTVKDVLQISETTLWRWAKAGYLQSRTGMPFTMSPTNVPHELSVGAIWHSRWHPLWHSTCPSR